MPGFAWAVLGIIAAEAFVAGTIMCAWRGRLRTTGMRLMAISALCAAAVAVGFVFSPDSRGIKNSLNDALVDQFERLIDPKAAAR
jgi:hypothetical protein